MNDRATGLLEQYDIEVLRTRKGRGAILCDTPSGCLIFREYNGSDEHLTLQHRLLEHLAADARPRGSSPLQTAFDTERLVAAREGGLSVCGQDGMKYILKTYLEGRECNVKDPRECAEAMRLLARLHERLTFADPADLPQPSCEIGGDRALYHTSPAQEYAKRNRELRRVHRYLKNRKQKTWFERMLLQNFDPFWEDAQRLAEEWERIEAAHDGQRPRSLTYCHGDYQYHNVLRTERGWMIVNFEHCVPDDPVRDLYRMMRKLLEKSGWSVPQGRELLAAYETIRPLTELSRVDLYYRLAYPEKFWKIVNFYYNSGKAWIPDKNLDKLQRLMAQEPAKQDFLKAVFGM